MEVTMDKLTWKDVVPGILMIVGIIVAASIRYHGFMTGIVAVWPAIVLAGCCVVYTLAMFGAGYGDE
jgi:hypothetical protein